MLFGTEVKKNTPPNLPSKEREEERRNNNPAMENIKPTEIKKEIIELFVKHNLYFKKSGVTAEVFNAYCDSLSLVADISKFVKMLGKKIGDTHSFVVLKKEENKTLEEKDIKSFDFESSLSDKIASIAVPAVFGDEVSYYEYAKGLFSVIKKLSQKNPTSWIIDLRKNWGGNTWPMLASLSSFFPKEGVVGLFKYADGKTEEWKYQSKAIFSGEKEMYPILDRLHGLEDVPITVLMSKETGSSGEAVAIAFKSRANTFFKGKKTAGMTTGNEPFILKDGSTLYLCTCEMADAKGIIYPYGIYPEK